MYISSLSIRNYRNFRNVRLKFKKGMNTILGENGSGKTNVFNALRLLIDDSLPRSIKLYESDFNRKLSQWFGHWIIISIEFSELGFEEELQALAIHSVGLMDESNKGRVTLCFRPNLETRNKIYEYSLLPNKSADGFNELLSKGSLCDYEFSYLGRGARGFEDDEDYKIYVGDFDNIVFPDPKEAYEDIFGVRIINGISIPNEVSCTFVKALRDVESDLRSYNRNPLLNLLRGEERTVSEEEKSDILLKVDDLNNQIGSLDEVKKISDGVGKSLTEAVGHTYAPNIAIKSELPNEMEELFQSLKLWVGDPDDAGYKGRIHELSLGGANLIYLSLKLLEYDRVKSKDKAANFLLIEEPESHIHAHIQKTLFNNLQTNRTQVIISTHSTHISSVSKVGSVNVLSRGDKESLVFDPSNELETKEVQRLERYLDAVRSSLLFAKGVVLVEGDAEQIIIPSLFKSVFGITLDELGVSLINIGSTGFENVAQIFSSKRLRKQCAIVTDLDKSIAPLNEDSSSDSLYEKGCRASQVSGARRKIKLDELYGDNQYVNIFYAEYTFEVDFHQSDNSTELIGCLAEIYEQEARRESSIDLINDLEVSVSGKEVLRLADKVGKGWFALLLEEQLSYETIIPSYVLKAIASASNHISKKTLVDMVSYRLKSIAGKEGLDAKSSTLLGVLEGGDMSENKILSDFKDAQPDDQLTDLIIIYNA